MRSARQGENGIRAPEFWERLISRGLSVIIPNAEEIEQVNDIIYHELCLGIISDDSREIYARIIEGLKKKGAQGVILGSTEIGLLISQKDSVLPIFDTTKIHAQKAALEAMK